MKKKIAVFLGVSLLLVSLSGCIYKDVFTTYSPTSGQPTAHVQIFDKYSGKVEIWKVDGRLTGLATGTDSVEVDTGGHSYGIELNSGGNTYMLEEYLGTPEPGNYALMVEGSGGSVSVTMTKL